MGADSQKTVTDALAWFLNVSTSVLIVFVNKVLMDPRKGYAFTFATTLCAFHFLTAAACVGLTQLLGWSQRAQLPWHVTLYFAVVANISIASLNLSLLLNTVGFYQIAKLLIIPFVCLVELFWMERRFTPPVVGSIVTVVIGVAIVTVTDVSIRPLGLVIAAISVVSSGMQQILCGTIQRTHKLQGHQLLANTAPVQGAMLLVVGPFVDKLVTGAWVTRYSINTPALSCLLLSCAISVAVNISQFMCLGRFSAVTFQVLGHTKTIVVLLTSWGVLHESMSSRKLSGMVLAVAGMVAYGYFNSLASGSSSSSSSASRAGEKLLLPVKNKPPEKEAAPLLPRDRSTPDVSSVVTAGSLKGAGATEKRMTATPSQECLTSLVVVK